MSLRLNEPLDVDALAFQVRLEFGQKADSHSEALGRK